MVDGEVREALAAGKARTEIQIGFFLKAGLFADQKQFAQEARAAAWTRLRMKIRTALDDTAGLRVVRESKAQSALAAIGPIGAWRSFLDAEKNLVGDDQLVIRRYWTPLFGDRF